jgi:cytochrome c
MTAGLALMLLAVASMAMPFATLPLGAQPSAGDVARGAVAFQPCAACHSVEPGVHLTGPSLARIWNRRAASVEGFTRYSEPLRKSGVVWDAAALDRWLTDPQALVPGNVMTFPGVKDPAQRADLIAYLKALAAGQAPAPKPGGRMTAAAARPDLKSLGPENRIKAIRYCGDGYHLTMEDGQTLPFWEYNLRFKTDSSPRGPAPGRPVLLPAGMQGDRASVVFSSPEEISRTVERKCP